MIRTSIQIANSRLTDNEFTSVYISQGIGRHNVFEIRLRQDALVGVLLEKTKNWIGEPVTIGLGDKEDLQIKLGLVEDYFKGIVTSLSLSRRSGTAELVIRGESPTITMDDGANTRSFTYKGLQEIVDEVINPYKGHFSAPPAIEPSNYSESIPYCVQYKESNFDFVNRLSSRYGEWFFYDGLNLTFGKPKEADPIKLNFGEMGLEYFDISVRSVPNQFEIKGYDYTKHEHLSEETPEKAELNELGKEALKASKNKIFTEKQLVQVQTYLDKSELKNIAERKEQINLDETLMVTGGSGNPKLKLGAVIELEDSIINDSYGKFTITSVLHHITQGGGYSNSFEAIPVEVQTPPLAEMPSPPFCEMQLAKVVDVNDEDSLGRVKVEFFWQEESGETSPWLRVASPYTGMDKGFYIIPEVDDQVLVAFENNNPEKPYVLSGMYNKEAKPEWFDAKNIYKGFKSKAQNEWKFDDKNKSITINAPSEITMSAGKTITIKTGGGGDSVINIDVGDGTVNISGKEINVKAAQTINLESDNALNAKGTQKAVVESTQKVEVKAVQVTVEGSAKSELKGAMVDVNGSGMVNVKGGMVKLN